MFGCLGTDIIIQLKIVKHSGYCSVIIIKPLTSEIIRKSILQTQNIFYPKILLLQIYYCTTELTK